MWTVLTNFSWGEVTKVFWHRKRGWGIGLHCRRRNGREFKCGEKCSYYCCVSLCFLSSKQNEKPFQRFLDERKKEVEKLQRRREWCVVYDTSFSQWWKFDKSDHSKLEQRYDGRSVEVLTMCHFVFLSFILIWTPSLSFPPSFSLSFMFWVPCIRLKKPPCVSFFFFTMLFSILWTLGHRFFCWRKSWPRSMTCSFWLAEAPVAQGCHAH